MEIKILIVIFGLKRLNLKYFVALRPTVSIIAPCDGVILIHSSR